MNANVQIGWLKEAFFDYCDVNGVMKEHREIEWNLFWKRVCKIKNREKQTLRRREK